MNKAIGDLISRTEAKDFVRSERGAELLKHFPLSAIIVLKLIDELPAADIAPVNHGLWIYFNCAGNELYQCSECFHWIDAKTDRNYCPNCGAKMETKNE